MAVCSCMRKPSHKPSFMCCMSKCCGVEWGVLDSQSPSRASPPPVYSSSGGCCTSLCSGWGSLAPPGPSAPTMHNRLDFINYIVSHVQKNKLNLGSKRTQKTIKGKGGDALNKLRLMEPMFKCASSFTPSSDKQNLSYCCRNRILKSSLVLLVFLFILINLGHTVV